MFEKSLKEVLKRGLCVSSLLARAKWRMRQYLKKNNPKDGAAIHGCSWLCGVDAGDTEK